MLGGRHGRLSRETSENRDSRRHDSSMASQALGRSAPIGGGQEESFVGCLDEQVLQDLESLGDEEQPDFLQTVIQQFLEDQPKHITAVETAIEDKDALALRKAAHSLKGSSLNVGAQALASRAMELEKLGAAGTLDGVEPLLVAFQKECRRARRALAQRIGTQSVGPS